MQTNQTSLNSTWEVKHLTKALVAVLACLAIWFAPFTHTFCQFLDYQIFALLNQSLLFSRPWQLLWGYLNHPNETWMNIILMLMINVLGIMTLPKSQRMRGFLIMLYSWAFFQLVLGITHKVFCDWIEVQRDSPSIHYTPWVILSEALGIPNIKVYSNSSFPAGHVLVLVFWARFVAVYAKPWVTKLAIATAIMFTLPRLISGAHWASDIIFTIAYANLWFYIAYSIPFFNKRLAFKQANINVVGLA